LVWFGGNDEAFADFAKRTDLPWAQHAWQVLAVQGQKLVNEGRTLESSKENVAELTGQATAFASKHLPIPKALQIA